VILLRFQCRGNFRLLECAGRRELFRLNVAQKSDSQPTGATIKKSHEHHAKAGTFLLSEEGDRGSVAKEPPKNEQFTSDIWKIFPDRRSIVPAQIVLSPGCMIGPNL